MLRWGEVIRCTQFLHTYQEGQVVQVVQVIYMVWSDWSRWLEWSDGQGGLGGPSRSRDAGDPRAAEVYPIFLSEIGGYPTPLTEKIG